jgi:hypothetical protein
MAISSQTAQVALCSPLHNLLLDGADMKEETSCLGELSRLLKLIDSSA